MRTKLITLTLALFISGPSFAGDAGCGLGAVIIQKNSKGLQLLASITNAVLFTQPLGITSGTSECSSSGIVFNDKQVDQFVASNKDDLSLEIAQGKGEKMATLAGLLGYTDSKEFAQVAQANYAVIYPSADTSSESVITEFKKLRRQ